MSAHTKIIFGISILFHAGLIANAQTTRTHTTNTNAWFMYFGNHKFSERWGVHAEIQARRHEIISEPQQLLFRAGVDYYSKANNRVTIGYAFVETYPYGEFAVPNAFPEHRTWQQFLTTQTLGNFKLSHRYRLEQRLIGNAATGKFEDGRYENRMRYMARGVVNLSKKERPAYLAMYDEIFINFGKDVGYNLFDQNRIYAAIGIPLNANVKIEFGYLHQTVLLRTLDAGGRNRIENNNTFQLAMYSTVPFR
jgi:hypothetical protein